MGSQTEAERRIEVVNEINGARANLGLAKERLARAIEEVAAIGAAVAAETDLYRMVRADLDKALASEDPDAAERALTATEAINASLERTEKRVDREQRAKSEFGTAKALVATRQTELDRALTKLKNLLPEP